MKKRKLTYEEHKELAELFHAIHNSFCRLYCMVMNSRPETSEGAKLAQRLRKQLDLYRRGDLAELQTILSNEAFRDFGDAEGIDPDVY